MTSAKIKWSLAAAGALAVFYLCLRHIVMVGKPVTFTDYFVLDVAFLPLQVFVVSVIIERLLHEREKRSMLKKLNMVVGAFFGEAGNELLRRLTPLCAELDAMAADLVPGPRWDDHDFDAAIAAVGRLRCSLRPGPAQLDDLRRFLVANRLFILALLQNPNLLEHEAFTNLLWAVTHLTEELTARDDFAALPPTDLAHLGGDLDRAYKLLVREWLAYLRHLRTDYPYIYSLSLRTCPLQPQATAVISE